MTKRLLSMLVPAVLCATALPPPAAVRAGQTAAGVIRSVHAIDWEGASGSPGELFLVLEDGREFRFAHAPSPRIRPGRSVTLELRSRDGHRGRIPVICRIRLETDGERVAFSSLSPLCPD